MIFYIMAGSYVVSGVLLAWARSRGQPVQGWAIAGWLAFGLIGFILTPLLGPGRWLVLAGLVAALAPWMMLSLGLDFAHRVWVMVALDLAGLFAIGFAAWQATR